MGEVLPAAPPGWHYDEDTGAVLVSPCISEGEREIARRAFVAGHRVITLANKGFSPLYKPGGKLFDTCAAGNLLMLAPVAWPYLPGEKKMTRVDACVLNRLAQLIRGRSGRISATCGESCRRGRRSRHGEGGGIVWCEGGDRRRATGDMVGRHAPPQVLNRLD